MQVLAHRLLRLGAINPLVSALPDPGKFCRSRGRKLLAGQWVGAALTLGALGGLFGGVRTA